MITFRSLLNILPVAVIVAAGSLQAQSVSMTVDQPSLSFSAQSGGAVVSQTVNVGSSNNQAINFNVQYGSSCGTWLKATPQSDNTPKQITITADPSGLTPGVYSGCVVSILGNGPSILGVIKAATIQVTFTVSSLSASPSAVVFPAYQAGTSTFPTPQSIAVTGGAFTISKAQADNWYTAAISGTPANTVLVFVDQSVLPTLAPKSYSGTLTITPSTGSNPVPINVPVSLTVAALPVVSIAPSPSTGLAFQWQVAGTNNQSQQNIVLSSNATGALGFTLTPSTSWIKLPNTNPNSLQPAGTTVVIGVDGTGLTAQTAPYTGTVTVTVTGGLFSNGQNSINIPISLTVSNFPLINIPASSLNFSYQFGSGAAVAAANITPTSSAAPGTQLQFLVGTSTCAGGNWLVVPSGLQATGTAFAVSVSPTVLATLPPQTYTCNLTVTPSGTQQSLLSIPVTLTITNTPTLQVSSTALVFAYQTGLSPVAPAPASQTITISSNSGVPLNYTVTAPLPTSVPWLKVTGNPSLTGITDQTSITVNVDPTAASAGVNDATITVAATDPATGLSAGSQPIDVKLYVSATPLLVVTPPGPIVLSGVGQSAGQPISLASTNTSVPLTTAVQFNAPGNWLSSNAPPTSTPGSFTIFGTPTGGMTPGSYPGTITINATGPGATAVADSPYTIPVTYQYNAATPAVQPTSLTFSQPLGGTAPAAKQVSVTTNGAALPFTAVANDGAVGWLNVTSGTGTTPGTFNVSVDASRLTSGTYSGAVYVTVANGGQIRIPVTFTVTPGAISAPTTALNFTQIAGGGAPPAQTIAVTGTTSLNFTVSPAVTTPAGGTWLNATVAGGSATGATPANVQVTVNAGSLQPGTYAGWDPLESTCRHASLSIL